MRIVQVVETLAVGGLETMAVNLAIAHRAAGHQSSIYTVFAPGALARKAEANGVEVVPFHKKPGFSPGAIGRMAARLRSDGAEIVHTHNGSIHHYGAVAGKLAGAAVVNTRHGLALHSAPRQTVYFRASLPITDAVVFVCDFGRRFWEQKGCAPSGRSRVILNGIPLTGFQSCRAAPGARRPAVRFGTIGRFVRAKAHTDLLEAFACVAADLPAAALSIWGYGELEQDLRNRAEALGLAGRVAFHGQAQAQQALASLDVFVLSSISEGLPLTILEAMAAGLPVVATRVGGVPEVLPADGAWIAEPGNPASLANAMRQAAASDLAHAGAVAYGHAAAHFGVESMQQSYERLFRELLEPATAARPRNPATP